MPGKKKISGRGKVDRIDERKKDIDYNFFINSLLSLALGSRFYFFFKAPRFYRYNKKKKWRYFKKKIILIPSVRKSLLMTFVFCLFEKL